MRFYLDASVLVGLLVPDALSTRADALLRVRRPVLLVSDFAAADFASALGRRVRMGQLMCEAAPTVFAGFDAWTAQKTQRIEVHRGGHARGGGIPAPPRPTLRAPDALHIAAAQRTGAALATFDEKMAVAAQVLGGGVLP